LGEMEYPAQQAEWGAKSVANNLGFIPADKLAWKPAPTAKSAFEIAQHLATALQSMRPVLEGGAWAWAEVPMPTTLEQAQRIVRESADAYVASLRAIKPEDLGKEVETPFGNYTLGMCSGFPVVDVIHHHGQIAYIQTLLGDEENHLQP
jgi:hypothetical protein